MRVKIKPVNDMADIDRLSRHITEECRRRK